MTKKEYFEKYKLPYDGVWKRCTFCNQKQPELMFLFHKVLICYDCFMGW